MVDRHEFGQYIVGIVLSPTNRFMHCATDRANLLPVHGVTLRIEAGIPRYGAELGEDTLPLEAGLLNALSFTKGCYIGQEIVERTRSRGHVNWMLVGLFVEASAPPAPGEKLFSTGRELGEVTSSCFSPTLGKTLALAYARREVSEPGTEFTLGCGGKAWAAALPFYSRSKTGN